MRSKKTETNLWVQACSNSYLNERRDCNYFRIIYRSLDSFQCTVESSKVLPSSISFLLLWLTFFFLTISDDWLVVENFIMRKGLIRICQIIWYMHLTTFRKITFASQSPNMLQVINPDHIIKTSWNIKCGKINNAHQI